MRDSLPIDHQLPEIQATLERHSRALLIAEPGAGKTTRVPLALLQSDWCREGRLLLLEPRRVAARLAAAQLAANLGESVGQTVGYRMRGESRVGPGTRLEVVTQGVLTRMLQADPSLEGVAGVIFDEFHERSLEADLGLALSLDAQSGLREELRLLVMSATLDEATLLGVLGEATPVLRCPGRSYPVTRHHRPQPSRERPERHQATVIREALAADEGDMLVFLPGVAEIRRLARELGDLDAQVLELHGRLPLAEQRRALAKDPQGRRRVVLSTALAESSVTVDGVRIVIDAGFERVPEFQSRTGLSRLVTRRVNRASAEQRQGRAARQGPGACYRLWAAEQALPPHGEPELLQADLAPLAFELARWGITEAGALAWVTPPPAAALAAGRAQLQRLGLLDAEHRLTGLGREAERWPCHPRLAAMLVRAGEIEARPLACWLAAALETGIEADDLAEAFRRLPGPRAQGAEAQWHREATRLARLAGVGLEVADLDPLGELAALAWPERVGVNLAPGRFKLAGGGQAWLPESHPLARVETLVALSLDGKPEGARIFSALAVTRSRLAAWYPEVETWRPRIRWDAEAGRLMGEEVKALDEAILARRPLVKLPAEAVEAALLAALRERGHLAFDEEGEQLRARMALLRRELSDEAWPDWSTPALLAELETWLAPHLAGLRSLEAVDRLPLGKLLLEGLEWSRRQRLEQLAPTHLRVPSGSRVRLDYRGEAPLLAVKLQELFGLAETPRLVEGRVPVLVQPLSPARRPLQTTHDLASFWRHGYFEVRKEMRGRYPKHPWPEDPLSAEATARTKRRGH
ncbi:ATP-dependent helicase HrpB [Halomonas salifodinae]|uniref:ATP-dependent helicase HrpB n=1 Tax=Halomonas salifodinae TaxID=438745 RepID=UPI0033AC6DD7